jgi:hypothetical protein
MAGSHCADALVPRDPVEPGPEVDLVVVRKHRLVGICERLLDRILRFLTRAQHVAAKGEDAAVMPLEEDGERLLVAGPHTRDEPLVGSHLEQVARSCGCPFDRQRRACPCRLHDSIIDTPVLVDEHFQFLWGPP